MCVCTCEREREREREKVVKEMHGGLRQPDKEYFKVKLEAVQLV